MGPVCGQGLSDFLPQPPLSYPVDEDDTGDALLFCPAHHAVKMFHLKGQHLMG